ncbi:MAG TPA: ATPase, T2SS/T4P/T4SS family [bacterium]
MNDDVMHNKPMVNGADTVPLAGRRRRPLGELLLDEGLISAEQLGQALEIQRSTGKRLGRVLLDMGAVGQEPLAEVLSQQMGIEFVRLVGVGIRDDLARRLPAAVARRLQAIPIADENGMLTVAMVDPLDVVAVDDIRRLVGMPVHAVITTLDDFQAAIDRYPVLEMAMEGLLKDLAAPIEEEISLETLRRLADEAPIVRLVNQFLEEAVRGRASDIHIERHVDLVRVRFRVDGMLQTKLTLPKHTHAQVISRVKILGNMDIAERRAPQDGSFQIQVDGRRVDIRVSTVPSIFGEKAVMRLLEKSASTFTLEKLGISPRDHGRLLQIIERPQGIFLITGPTGSGKTTTLYAILNRLNRDEVNILTIEDPVEYQIGGITQVQVNPRAGVAFASTLRHFLRQDPDIILVGEVRDEETARIAMQAALTGHLVLSTLHANDAVASLPRLIDMGIEPYLVASSLEGVAAQRLVRVLCTHCRKPHPTVRDELPRLAMHMPEEGTYYHAVGCEMCSYTGYRGRVAVFEVIPLDDELRQMIVSRVAHHELKKASIARGMTTMFQDGMHKASRGITTIDEVLRVVELDRDID